MTSAWRKAAAAKRKLRPAAGGTPGFARSCDNGGVTAVSTLPAPTGAPGDGTAGDAHAAPPTEGDSALRLDLPPLTLGNITVNTPVILAPMAGITNKAFRRLCREYGGGLYVSEMVTSRALVERSPESMRIISHDGDEKVRSVQLYGVDPRTVGAAVRLLIEEDRADQIDLNFGCPVPKVTRKGGGAALAWKLDLFTGIVQTAVREASRGNVPLTIKMRKGIDED
ncbi:MAG: tRNA dihydrouridine synthase DusB, partial [Micrococcaceae bacterium]|nr:tRNA dihydrouridine synthase DusB [Micrococcaceae bacterium]